MKKIFKIFDMHCTSCAMNIDGELEETEGIKESNTSYAKSQTTVEFDEKKIDESKITEIIKNIGYKASLIN